MKTRPPVEAGWYSLVVPTAHARQVACDAALAAARPTLGDIDYHRAWNDGITCTLEEAISELTVGA